MGKTERDGDDRKERKRVMRVRGQIAREREREREGIRERERQGVLKERWGWG